MPEAPIRFCSQCGQAVQQQVPPEDDRPRAVCTHCDTVHYQNPKVVTGCVPVWGRDILLCRRAIEPRLGYWTLPAGFMENGESLLDGALREAREEACAELRNPELFGIYNLLPVHQVYVMYRAELVAADSFAVGPESSEVRLFRPEDIPWEDISFRVITRTLKRFLEEQRHGNFSLQVETLA